MARIESPETACTYTNLRIYNSYNKNDIAEELGRHPQPLQMRLVQVDIHTKREREGGRGEGERERETWT